MTNGTRATDHAWLWIMRNDGVWFWIDPTWTDNSGYVVYGYVDNGEEVQLRPDKELCINYPDYLYNLPLPPKWGKELAPSSSTTSSSSTSVNNSTYSSNNSTSSLMNNYLSIGYIGSLESIEKFGSEFFNFNKYGLEISAEAGPDINDLICIISFDYLSYYDYSEEKSLKSCLLGLSFGYGLIPIFQPYIGSAIGYKRNDKFETSNMQFSWKINGGFRIDLDTICIRTDISYGTILGFAGIIAVGFRVF
jgi:hypothetical protein